MSKRFPPIPEFVEPYPDESCYSILCRCAVRAPMSTTRFCREMFTKQRFLSYYLWQPFHAEEMNRWFDDTPERIQKYMLKHSCVSYRYPFLSRMNRENLEDWSAGEELSVGIHQHLTLKLGCRAWKKRYLYYCPECVRTDRRNYGETYWHMIPQLPGVFVCPIHGVPLEQSSLTQKASSWMDLYPADYWLPDTEVRKETISYDDLRLATDSKWMMENGWNTEIKIHSLLEGLTTWQFEQAEAQTRRFTSQRNVKNETIYHILLANMKGKSIADYMIRHEIMEN